MAEGESPAPMGRTPHPMDDVGPDEDFDSQAGEPIFGGPGLGKRTFGTRGNGGAVALGSLLAGLPRHLVERSALAGPADIPRGGGFVVYWAHHALRVDENPALELAAELAWRLDQPLLVSTGVFLEPARRSDRHVTFVIEAVRDFMRRLAELGVPAVASLDPCTSSTELERLVRRASVVVTEDFPAAPFPDWTGSLARRCAVPAVLVDTACVVPMNRVDGVYDRAFAFRDATERERSERVAAPWPRSHAAWLLSRGRWPLVEHGMGELDWSSLDIPAVVARMEIDHLVGPVADTEGGSDAGLARWQRFREHALDRYALDRDDAACVEGVSRMSAYLGHGMVSPLRIAREAHADLGVRAGAGKFLEELLVWRELAYQWCRHSPSHGRLDCLPAWARRMLRAHALDERRIHGRVALGRGMTGDPLWDLAQRSLVAHGELHNNLRMTWGKAIPAWTRSPESALATLLELNNRFALDGGDPASYGGLLWCLGLFDRAFSPESPVLGSVRPRPTDAHAQRIDLAAFAQWVGRRPTEARVAVIGAGLAGVACAAMLADHNISVTVFEKSRGTGGRMATRRGEAGSFDHGAQYLTARDPRFARAIADWSSEGFVEEWHARFAEVGAQGATPIESAPRFVAVPGMSSLCSRLARGLAIVVGARIEPLRRGATGWIVESLGPAGEVVPHGEFDIVLSTAPAPQTAALLGAVAPALAGLGTRAAMRAVWSMMWSSETRVELPFDHAEILSGAPRLGESLGWVSRISAKPGRAQDGIDRWVVHARPEWSEDRLERSAEEMRPCIEAEFAALCESLGCRFPRSAHAVAHRFRFALAAREGGPGPQYDAALGIGIAGDWLSGTRVEDAYLSGVALGARVLGAVTQDARARASATRDMHTRAR